MNNTKMRNKKTFVMLFLFISPHDLQEYLLTRNICFLLVDVDKIHPNNIIIKIQYVVFDLIDLKRLIIIWYFLEFYLLLVPFVVWGVAVVMVAVGNGVGRFLLSSSFDTWVMIDDKSNSFDVLFIVKRVWKENC